MAELFGIDLALHLESIFAEFKANSTIYGYPKRKMFLGFPDQDLSVVFHDRRAATVLGPASGPHSQMVQNIILSFLGGGRIMELKTVQILDQLDIPRPCIDIRNIGFNVEWSQEMRLEDSFQEYVTAWILLKILEDSEILGIPKGSPFYDTIFDISVGYDLKGIRSQRMDRWLSGFKNADGAIERILDDLPDKFANYKNLNIDPKISNSVTLSTFHGCPADEIESIVRHLIETYGFHVIVKMNPTILGYRSVEKTLRHDLGYHHLELDPEAFENDVSFDEAVAMMKRLQTFASRFGCNVGAKFTNTLVVKNNEEIFSDDVMYLSGAPLHVLAMHAMHRFRTAMGQQFHISFSAGITKHNFVDAVVCNMRPVTTCTDLLKEGGFTRMYTYLQRLQEAMETHGCQNLHELICARAGESDLYQAGVKNAQRLVPKLIDNERYHHKKNHKAPPKIDSHLELFDCITCNKCLPVCPNAANFSIPTGLVDRPMTNYQVRNGQLEPTNGQRFVLNKAHQIANLADFCNECGDCDTYCPEYGGPFIEKPRFFFSAKSYHIYDTYDGFYFPDDTTMTGRIDGVEYSLIYNKESQEYTWRTSQAKLKMGRDHDLISAEWLGDLNDGDEIDMTPYHIMRVLFDGIKNNAEHYTSVMLVESNRKEKSSSL